MEKKITLRNNEIAYTLRKSNRARKMRIAVYCDGTVVVTTPSNLKESHAEVFITKSAGWLLTKLDFFRKIKGSSIQKYDRSHYLNHRKSAHAFASARVEYFNKFYRFHFNKINIKNQKTRWGSCSRKRNLNFNYKIIFLPPEVADYIIVHELCHLKEFNHSAKFWKSVERTMPNYLKIREQLRTTI